MTCSSNGCSSGSSLESPLDLDPNSPFSVNYNFRVLTLLKVCSSLFSLSSDGCGSSPAMGVLLETSRCSSFGFAVSTSFSLLIISYLYFWSNHSCTFFLCCSQNLIISFVDSQCSLGTFNTSFPTMVSSTPLV